MQIKEQVAGYVAELLKPRFKANSISKEGYKWVVRKTVEKVSHILLSTVRFGNNKDNIALSSTSLHHGHSAGFLCMSKQLLLRGFFAE